LKRLADNDTGTLAENAAAVVEILRWRSGTGFDFVDADANAEAESAVDETAG
jgi:hypothetical protein